MTPPREHPVLKLRSLQHASRVTGIGTLLGKNLGESCGPHTEPLQNSRKERERERSKRPSEKQCFRRASGRAVALGWWPSRTDKIPLPEGVETRRDVRHGGEWGGGGFFQKQREERAERRVGRAGKGLMEGGGRAQKGVSIDIDSAGRGKGDIPVLAFIWCPGIDMHEHWKQMPQVTMQHVTLQCFSGTQSTVARVRLQLVPLS